MKDLDAKLLESMYDEVAGVPSQPIVFINESFDRQEVLIIENLIATLGATTPTAVNAVRRMFILVEKELPICENNAVQLKTLENNASLVLKNLVDTTNNPMVGRFLSTYSDTSSIDKLKVLYRFLTDK